jgi:hypothetical protein
MFALEKLLGIWLHIHIAVMVSINAHNMDQPCLDVQKEHRSVLKPEHVTHRRMLNAHVVPDAVEWEAEVGADVVEAAAVDGVEVLDGEVDGVDQTAVHVVCKCVVDHVFLVCLACPAMETLEQLQLHQLLHRVSFFCSL